MMTEEQRNDESPCGAGQRREGKKCVMPEVTFSSFYMALYSAVLLHLGEIPDPTTGQREKNLLLAKHTIDTLSMLQEKTKGNLTAEEDKMLQNTLYELKMRYVQASQK